MAQRCHLSGADFKQTSGRQLNSRYALPMLREAKERGDAIVSLPWVRSWLRDSQKPSMLLESFAGGSDSCLDWPTTVAELKSNWPIAYAAVTHNLHAVIQGMMWAGREMEPASRWLFLPNGNAA